MRLFSCTIIVGIIIIFSSCNGQKKSKVINISENIIVSNKLDIKLDKKKLLVFQDSKNNYWFGGNDKGAYKYDGEKLSLYSTKDGLVGSNVFDIKEDTFGNLYFDTPKGVSKFDGTHFTTLEIIENDATANQWKLEPNDLWFRIEVNGYGPYRFDGKYLYQLKFPKTSLVDEFYTKYPSTSYSPYGIYKIYNDSKGNVWFGTSSLGAFRFDGTSITWLYEEQLQKTPSGGDFGMRSIIEDKNGNYWFNNSRYQFKILPNNIESKEEVNTINYTKEKGIYNSIDEKYVPYFLSIAEDNSGDLWMATYQNGVWRNNGTELIHYPVKDGEKEVLLFSIYKDNQGVLWLGSHNAGVYKYNGKAFEKFKP